ncbi:hypothetical protein BGX30_004798 [Mortierella sp. GBA39]|nr:hypothetical protein BGX30_004798 [Mortierella sp. GBA39]
MSLQPHHSALDVPEILYTVGSFMDHESLASCLLVSRYFHQALEPLFFSHLYLVYDKTRRPSPALIQSQYLHRVRHLFTIHFISVDYLLLDFRNLTSINLEGFVYRGSYDYDEDDKVADPDQVGIWEALACPTESQSEQQEHIRTAATATNTNLTGPRLDVLDITFTTIDHKSVPFFLAACRATKTLRLSSCTVQGLWDSHTRLLYDTLPPHADVPYFPQSVEFADIIGLSVLAQLEFLARCPNVQKIHWQTTTRSSHYVKPYRLQEQDNVISVNQPLPSTDDIRRFIQPGAWMHLQSLVVSGVYSPYYGKALEFIQDEGFAHILESIPTQHLVELDCCGTAFGPLGLEALKRHCDVLRLLVIKRSSSFTSALVQEALESFPKLTSLQVDRLSVEDVERGRPWACLNLRVLIAQFDMGGAVDVEDDQRRHRLLFDRISTLAGLERLDITAIGAVKVPRPQFRISHGLDALSCLKNLYYLNVSKTEQRLELSDIRWIIDNWLKLCIVEGSLYHDDRDQNRLLQELLGQHNITINNHG